MSESQQGTAFDPSKYLVQLNGRGEYLEVKWRLLWLRSEHPDAVIETEMIRERPDEAVFKATITIPNGGGSASGFGSETRGDFRDFLEKAETKAIGRACAALGYGTQFCQDHDYGGQGSQGTPVGTSRVVDAPVTRPKPPMVNVEQQQRKPPAKPPVPPAPATPDKAAVRKNMEEKVADDSIASGKRIPAAVWLVNNAESRADLDGVTEGLKALGLTSPQIDKAVETMTAKLPATGQE